jgi:uncharacterized protein (DUF488 family)
MCSEENPRACHRRLLIARVLVTRSIRVDHIRGDGGVETEAALQSEERSTTSQTSLFVPTEEQVWRSIQSVSPRGRQRSSSER